VTAKNESDFFGLLAMASIKIQIIGWLEGSTRWRSSLGKCTISRRVAGSIPDGVIGISHWRNPSCHNTVLVSTQFLREMSKKAVPLQLRRGPEGSGKLRFPGCVTMAQDGGRLSALCTGHLYPKKCSWYSFLLEVESTPGP